VSFFFIVFFALYSLMHLYALLRARAAWPFGLAVVIPLTLFMLLMAAAPIIVRMLENRGLESAARFSAYAGYIWMGALFLFCSASAVVDIYRVSLRLAALLSGLDLAALVPTAKAAFVVPLCLSLAASLYGYCEALNIRKEQIIITSPKIPKEAGTLTIAQISDVHLGLIVRQERLARILAVVKEADPDIFVSTGDLVDGQISLLNGLSDLLGEIKPRYGKFAITGNHEFYAGLGQALDFTRRAGFTVLRGEAVTGVINIAGVEDPAARALGLPPATTEKELLASLPPEKFTLLLKHRPLVDPDAAGLFDLQLSGHVHKGQIFPFSLITKAYYPVYAGYIQLSGSAHLYVSRGTGTWGPPIRFLAPPEVTIIKLMHGEEK
jgi:hypothetical protein